MISIKRLLTLLSAIATLSIAAQLCAANTTVELNTKTRLYLNQHASFLKENTTKENHQQDIAKLLTVENLWTQERENLHSSIFNFIHLWQKIRVKNSSSESKQLFIVNGEPSAIDNKVVIVRNGTVTESWSFGAGQPFTERPYDHRLFLMPITLHANETITVLWQTYTNGISSRLWIEEQQQFWLQDSIHLFSDGMYFGIITLISLLTIFLFIINRTKSAVYLYLMLAGNAVYNFWRGGYGAQYIWPNGDDITITVVLITVNLSTIGGILFSTHFLQLKQYSKYLWRLSIAFLTINFFIVALAAFGPVNFAVPAITINLLLTTVYFLTLILYSLKLSLKGDFWGKIYLIAWLLFLLPYAVGALLWFTSSPAEHSLILKSRNGDIFLAITLYVALLFEARKTQIEKKAAILEATAKTSFVATMSHELRTPLNGVIGMAELLHQTKQTPTQKLYSDIIISSGNVLLSLINDILDLTKITGGKLTLEKKSFDLDNVIAECCSTFLPLMIKQQTHLFVSLSPDMPLVFIGDEYRIRQIIYNLLSNALKFTEHGNVSLLATATIGQADSATVTIVIKDTGIGIEPQALNAIFDQFSQADSSTTRRFGGTGLGLTITRSIIEKMGGDISATSEINKGSVFTINLPLKVDISQEFNRQQSLKPLNNKRVLIITDYPDNFKVTTPHLLRWGIKLDLCETANQAKALVKSTPYDCLIAFFIDPNRQFIQQLRSSRLPLLNLQYLPFDEPPPAWDSQLINVAVPTSIQQLATTLNQLFDHNIATDCATNDNNHARPSTATPILIVEDNPTNQLVIKGMFKNMGLETELAENGEQAVQMYQQKHYPLIFMDCEMPVMDGFEASQKIIALANTSKPIIIALTAHATDEIQQRCLNSGMSQVLHKPITLSRLQDCLNNTELNS